MKVRWRHDRVVGIARQRDDGRIGHQSLRQRHQRRLHDEHKDVTCCSNRLEQRLPQDKITHSIRIQEGDPTAIGAQGFDRSCPCSCRPWNCHGLLSVRGMHCT
jgi:hypothetical protein